MGKQESYKSIDEPYMLNIDCPSRPIAIIGDIHGCGKELVSLTKKVEDVLGETTFISLGDLVDRGPFSYESLSLFSAMGYQILGNHEKKLIKRLLGSNVTENDDQKWYNALTQQQIDNILDWCSDLPCIIRIRYPNGHIYNLAHAAIHDSIYNIPFEIGRTSLKFKQRDTALYGHTTGAKDKNGYPERLHVGCLKPNQTNVFGHIIHPNQSLDGFILTNEPGTTIQIDHGCVHGGHLTALCIEPDGGIRFISQKSKEIYMKSKSMEYDLNWNYNA